MEFVFIVLGGLAGLILLGIVILIVIAENKPGDFRIERSATINAPAEKIFPLIADFHNWANWSPWEQLDPQLRRTYSGSPSGLGAVYEWEGNKKVGQGRMEITEAQPPAKITIKLDFLKPFEAHNTAEFALTGQGSSTDVTWAMIGQKPLMLKVMSAFMDMDKMVGKDFESGLANMKALAEK